MKKYTLLIIISLLTQISYSQNNNQKKWITFKNDEKIKYDKEHILSGTGLKKDDFPITILKSEIYKISKNKNKNFIVFGTDTLKYNGGSEIKFDDDKYKNILKSRDELIKKQKGKEKYNINISSIDSIYDKEERYNKPVIFISNDEEYIFINDISTQYKTLASISKFIIPGYPTLIYYKNELKEFTITPPDSLKTTETKDKNSLASTTETDASLFKNVKKWVKKWVKKNRNNYILIVWFVLFLGILFTLYILLINKICTPIYTEGYSGESLPDFAKNNNTTVKKLIKLNKELSGYDASKNHKDGKNQKILKKIKNKKLKKGSVFFQKKDSNSKGRLDESSNKTVAPVTIDTTEINNHLSNQFKNQAELIKREFSNLKSNNLNDEIKSLRKEKDKLNDENLKFKQLYENAESNILKYTNIINFTPFLTTIGYNYFNLLESLSDCQNRMNDLVINNHTKLSDKELNAIFKINAFYPNSFDTSYWRKLFQNLSEEGFLSDSKLIMMLNDFKSEKEKTAFLEKYIYNNFWKKYINTILLYIENIRLLSEFTGEKTETSTSIEKEATACVKNIVSKSKQYADLDINYASLLKNYEDYTFTRVSSDQADKFFLNLDTDSENIIKIISFGFKDNHNFENEETCVIIK